MSRITGSNGGPRPGQAFCRINNKDNEPQASMLGGAGLYSNNRSLQNNAKINGVQMLLSNSDKITRLQSKLDQIENINVINISSLENKMNKQEKLINLITGDYKEQINTMRNYIKSLELKIKELKNHQEEEEYTKELIKTNTDKLNKVKNTSTNIKLTVNELQN